MYKPPTTIKQLHTNTLNQAIFISESAAVTYPQTRLKHPLAPGNLLHHTSGTRSISNAQPSSYPPLLLVQYPSTTRGSCGC